MLRIIESLIKGSTTEQLDETFEELMKAISLRSAQGMGTTLGIAVAVSNILR